MVVASENTTQNDNTKMGRQDVTILDSDNKTTGRLDEHQLIILPSQICIGVYPNQIQYWLTKLGVLTTFLSYESRQNVD